MASLAIEGYVDYQCPECGLCGTMPKKDDVQYCHECSLMGLDIPLETYPLPGPHRLIGWVVKLKSAKTPQGYPPVRLSNDRTRAK